MHHFSRRKESGVARRDQPKSSDTHGSRALTLTSSSGKKSSRPTSLIAKDSMTRKISMMNSWLKQRRRPSSIRRSCNSWPGSKTKDMTPSLTSATLRTPRFKQNLSPSRWTVILAGRTTAGKALRMKASRLNPSYEISWMCICVVALAKAWAPPLL